MKYVIFVKKTFISFYFFDISIAYAWIDVDGGYTHCFPDRMKPYLNGKIPFLKMQVMNIIF